MEKHLLAFPNRCTGCSRCTYACSATKEGMFMPSKSRIKVTNLPQKGYSVPHICFQCSNADCMKACPTGAIFKNNRNVIVVDTKKCDGCGDCLTACAYGMIEQYGSGKAYKCDLCGGTPACVAECHYGALVFRQTDKVFLKCRTSQMKQKITDGKPKEKRLTAALNIMKSAIRVPRTVGYTGE